MKIFQTKNGFCFKDITALRGKFDLLNIESLHAVEAPDYVFEGWGYNETAEGDARFIGPKAPEGWEYDEETGTFFQPSPPPTMEERIAALESAMLAMMGGADNV